MLAQAPGRNHVVLGIPLAKRAHQKAQGSFNASVLIGVVEYHDSVAAHFAKGIGPPLRHEDVYVGAVPKVLAHHEGFIADILRKVFELHLTHVLGAAAVAST